MKKLRTKFKKNIIRENYINALALTALTTAISPFACAVDAEGWYGGLSVGDSTSNMKNKRIAETYLGDTFTVESLVDDRRDTGYKIFGGYQFNDYVAVEGGYFDLGKTGFSAQVTPLGTLDSNTKVKGANMDVLAIAPVNDTFSVFARFGINYASAKDRVYGSGAAQNINTEETFRHSNLKYGVGVQYQINREFALRFEGERYRLDENSSGDKSNRNLISLGLVYRFGMPEKATHEAKQVNVPISPIPPPPPVINKQEYCTLLNIEFEIDKFNVQREEKEKLSVVATFLKKYPNTTAVIEGYTDNVGTAEDNLALSQHRAESVIEYLVKNHDIVKTRLSAVGFGETHPIDDNATEIGKRHNRRINAVISCATDIAGLQPLPARVTMALLLEFEHNKADIAVKYRPELEKVATFLNENPSLNATVEGHTADTTAENSQRVSQLRAQNVVNYLVENFNVSRTRLTAEGFGQSRRYAYNTSAEGRQDNRRVNIIIDYPSKK